MYFCDGLMGLWTVAYAVAIFPAFTVMVIISIITRRLFFDKPYVVRMLPLKNCEFLCRLSSVQLRQRLLKP